MGRRFTGTASLALFVPPFVSFRKRSGSGRGVGLAGGVIERSVLVPHPLAAITRHTIKDAFHANRAIFN
jgi:hypothetical protein